MQLRTYTGLWKIERRLYKFYDISLPYPVSLRQLAVFLGTGIPWIGLLAAIGFPLETPWHVVWIAPPVIATIIGNRPIAEGKTPVDWLTTQTRFLMSPRTFHGLHASTEPDRVRLSARVWTRTVDELV